VVDAGHAAAGDGGDGVRRGQADGAQAPVGAVADPQGVAVGGDRVEAGEASAEAVGVVEVAALAVHGPGDRLDGRGRDLDAADAVVLGVGEVEILEVDGEPAGAGDPRVGADAVLKADDAGAADEQRAVVGEVAGRVAAVAVVEVAVVADLERVLSAVAAEQAEGLELAGGAAAVAVLLVAVVALLAVVEVKDGVAAGQRGLDLASGGAAVAVVGVAVVALLE